MSNSHLGKCGLCKAGFPRNQLGEHYGTQSLGMIPNSRCLDMQPAPSAATETPRTEPYKGRWATYWHNNTSIYEHACQLERSLVTRTAELEEAKADSIALQAWHSQFGTSQLSHAIAERDKQKSDLAATRQRCEELEKQVQTLSDFARTAPGRLPQAVQDALLPWRPTKQEPRT